MRANQPRAAACASRAAGSRRRDTPHQRTAAPPRRRPRGGPGVVARVSSPAGNRLKLEIGAPRGLEADRRRASGIVGIIN